MSKTTFSAFDLKANHVYRVIAPFKDFDGVLHLAGERWHYQSRNYFPYDAGLSLNIEGDGGLRSIRLQDYPEAQRGIIESVSDFVVEDEPSGLS
jgi:hypothetical protein